MQRGEFLEWQRLWRRAACRGRFERPAHLPRREVIEFRGEVPVGVEHAQAGDFVSDGGVAPEATHGGCEVVQVDVAVEVHVAEGIIANGRWALLWSQVQVSAESDGTPIGCPGGAGCGRFIDRK